MNALLRVLIGLLLTRVALAKPATFTEHTPYNHLTFWTDVDEFTRQDTIGREIVLHPDRRAHIDKHNKRILIWSEGDKASASTSIYGHNSQAHFEIDASGMLKVKHPGSFQKYEVQLTHAWRVNTNQFIALSKVGRLFIFDLLDPTLNNSTLHIESFNLKVLFPNPDDWQIRIDSERIEAYNYPVTKVFLLKPNDDQPSYVLCPIHSDDSVAFYAARVRFDPSEAAWPTDNAPMRKPRLVAGIVSQIPPFSLELPKSSQRGVTGLSTWVSAGAGVRFLLVEDVTDPRASAFGSGGLRYEAFDTKLTVSPFRALLTAGGAVSHHEYVATYSLVGGVWLGHPVIGVAYGIETNRILRTHFEAQAVWLPEDGPTLAPGGTFRIGYPIHTRTNTITPGLFFDAALVRETYDWGKETNFHGFIAAQIQVGN